MSKPSEPEGRASEECKQRAERMNQIMWAYVCGAIALLSLMLGFGASFIPPGFAVLGGVLDWQLLRKGERRHSAIAGALALGGLLIWLTMYLRAH
jgi:4-amino-4-deoxy-L-arabinose transferase-like glycosyltransferase